MIQRIQTVYLFLAALLVGICAFLPIGTLSTANSDTTIELTNNFITAGENSDTIFSLISFALLIFNAAMCIYVIFLYNNRRSQATMCMILIAYQFMWYIICVLFAFVFNPEGTAFTPSAAAIMPAAAIVLTWLARRAIIADEKLVRAADRIR